MRQQYKTEAIMNNFNIIFIGLDTHKIFTQLAVLKDERGAKPESFGKIKTNKSVLIKFARQLQSKYHKATLHFIYEAGPCGYWIYRPFMYRRQKMKQYAIYLAPEKPA